MKMSNFFWKYILHMINVKLPILFRKKVMVIILICHHRLLLFGVEDTPYSKLQNDVQDTSFKYISENNYNNISKLILKNTLEHVYTSSKE